MSRTRAMCSGIFAASTSAVTATIIPTREVELVTLRLRATIKSQQSAMVSTPGHVGTGAPARPGRAKPGSVSPDRAPVSFSGKRLASRDPFPGFTGRWQKIFRSGGGHGVQRHYSDSFGCGFPEGQSRKSDHRNWGICKKISRPVIVAQNPSRLKSLGMTPVGDRGLGRQD